MKVYNTLSDIAHLCPYAGGPAVFMARNILAMYGPAHYDDENACVQVGYTMRKGANDAHLPAQISVHPNPADEKIIFIGEKIQEGRRLVLYDALNRKVMEVTIGSPKGRVEIDIQGLSEGVYFYHFDGEVMGKFLISR